MKTTRDNIRENSKVSIVAENNREYYRIDGEAMICSSGKYLDVALERSEPPLPKCALAITVREVFDLDNGKKIL